MLNLPLEILFPPAVLTEQSKNVFMTTNKTKNQRPMLMYGFCTNLLRFTYRLGATISTEDVCHTSLSS